MASKLWNSEAASAVDTSRPHWHQGTSSSEPKPTTHVKPMSGTEDTMDIMETILIMKNPACLLSLLVLWLRWNFQVRLSALTVLLDPVSLPDTTLSSSLEAILLKGYTGLLKCPYLYRKGDPVIVYNRILRNRVCIYVSVLSRTKSNGSWTILEGQSCHWKRAGRQRGCCLCWLPVEALQYVHVCWHLDKPELRLPWVISYYIIFDSSLPGPRNGNPGACPLRWKPPRTLSYSFQN